jgi:hypothetical protein
MRALRILAALAFMAAVVAAIVSLTGNAQAGSLAFALGGVALTAGVTALIDYSGRWGVPGDGL